MRKRISPTALDPRAGEVQYLGEMPWEGRATAFKPDVALMIQNPANVKISRAADVPLDRTARFNDAL
jgi:hypothetical protein